MENAQQRFERYELAQAKMNEWEGLLEQAYRYALPKNNHYTEISDGQTVMNQVYDSTAIEATQSFANNIQSVITPPFMRWASLEAGDHFSDDVKKQIDDQLDATNETLFKYLRQSNLDLVINEAFQELALSTGVLFIKEGTQEEPFIFDSASTSTLVLDAGTTGQIESFWRCWNIELRKIKQLWPDADLTQLSMSVKGTPNQKIELIEGFIYYPDESESKQNYYYVCVKDSKKEIVTRYMDFSPLIAFRFSRRSSEVLGRGPVLTALPFIKVLNRWEEFALKAGAMIAYPPFMAHSAGVVNPNNLRIEPKAIIPVKTMGNPSFPIQQLAVEGNLQYSMEKTQSLQVQIRNMLFANPLPALINQTTKTATEISLLQQNWMRENAAAFGRLITELLNPLTKRCIHILYKKGLIRDVIVNGNRIDVRKLNMRYKSPIAQLQEQQDLQRVQTYVNALVGTYGQAGVLALNDTYAQKVAEKLDIDSDWLNPEFPQVVDAIQSKITDAATQNQPAPQAANPAPVDNQQQALDVLDSYLQQPGQAQA